MRAAQDYWEFLINGLDRIYNVYHISVAGCCCGHTNYIRYEMAQCLDQGHGVGGVPVKIEDTNCVPLFQKNCGYLGQGYSGVLRRTDIYASLLVDLLIARRRD